MKAALHRRARPRPIRIGGSEPLSCLAVDVREDVELAVMVAEGRRPDSLAVDILAVLQPVGRPKVELVHGIGDEFPVDQVLRAQDRQARHGVHRGARQVEPELPPSVSPYK